MTMAVAVGAMAVMSSCSENQSSFDIEQVPGRSTIEGTIVFNQGATLQDGKFVYNYQPAANLPVNVIVDNTAYDNGLSGKTVFNTVTDENGKYTIEIPAPVNQTNVTIRTAQFTGKHTTVERVNNKIETVERNAVYWANGSTYIVAEGHSFANLECTIADEDSEFKNFSQTATLKGMIGRNAEYYNAPEKFYNDDKELTDISSANIDNCFVPAPNADMMVTVTYDNKKYVYNATTDAAGNFTLNVPVLQFPANFSYSIEIMPQMDVTYTHYVPVTKTITVNRYGYEQEIEYWDYEPVKMNGWYSQYSNASNTTGSLNYDVASFVNNIEVKGLIFRTQSEIMSENNYYPAQFEYNLPWMSELEEEK